MTGSDLLQLFTVKTVRVINRTTLKTQYGVTTAIISSSSTYFQLLKSRVKSVITNAIWGKPSSSVYLRYRVTVSHEVNRSIFILFTLTANGQCCPIGLPTPFQSRKYYCPLYYLINKPIIIYIFQDFVSAILSLSFVSEIKPTTLIKGW